MNIFYVLDVLCDIIKNDISLEWNNIFGICYIDEKDCGLSNKIMKYIQWVFRYSLTNNVITWYNDIE